MSEETIEKEPASQEPSKKKSGLSMPKLFGFIVVVAIIIVAIGYFVMNISGGEAVALVNGQKISRSDYNQLYNQIAASVTSQGLSATSTEIQAAIKKQALDSLVSNALILQAAGKEGIKADANAVNTAFTQSKSQFTTPAAYQKALSDQGFTDSSFKDTLTRNNIIQQYLKIHVDVSSATATDKEIKALYDQAAAGNKNVPPLAQVRTQVENQIITQKQQALITNFLQKLQASSTIQILLK